MSYKEPKALTNDFGLIRLAGDLAGTADAPIVAKLDGYSLPSPTPGVLEEVGGILQWGAVNLSSSTYVTGTLSPINIGTITLTGDVTGSASGGTISTTVASISGNSPIAITPTNLQWTTATSAPVLNQADNTSNSATGQTLTIQAQNATGTTTTGGTVILTSGTGTTVAGTINIQTGGTTKLSVTPSTTTVSNALTQSGGTVSLTGNGASSFTTTSSTLTLDAVTAVNIGNINATSILAGNTTNTTLITINGTTGSIISMTPPTLQWASTVTSPTINQATISSASGTNLTVEAQNATGASNNGGNLLLAGGTSGSATAGTVELQTAGTTRLTANATGVITIANLSTGVVHTDSSGNLTSSPVNLSGGSIEVTGTLPSGNQASQSLTLTGDVTSSGGTTASASTTVAKIQGVVISGVPASGYVLEATSPTSATWQLPSSFTQTSSIARTFALMGA